MVSPNGLPSLREGLWREGDVQCDVPRAPNAAR
jgi:hypothetical protein